MLGIHASLTFWFHIRPYIETALSLLKLACDVRCFIVRFSVGLCSDILSEETLSAYSTQTRVLAVWRAIIHTICSGGVLPHCKVA